MVNLQHLAEKLTALHVFGYEDNDSLKQRCLEKKQPFLDVEISIENYDNKTYCGSCNARVNYVTYSLINPATNKSCDVTSAVIHGITAHHLPYFRYKGNHRSITIPDEKIAELYDVLGEDDTLSLSEMETARESAEELFPPSLNYQP